MTPDASANIEMVAPVLERYGFSGKWAFRGGYEGGKCYGMSEDELMRLYREADAFLNVTASQELREEHMSIPRRVYVRVRSFPCPGKGIGRGHEDFERPCCARYPFFFGENLGQPDCDLPIDFVCWHPTRQPVLMDLWGNPFPAPRRIRSITTITTWKNKGKDLVFRGRDLLLDKGPGVFQDHRPAEAQTRWF